MITQTNNMRYISRIRLENFQSHKDTDIYLEPGINLFTGLGDAGKTAILRALNLVLHNQPRGKEFIRWGETEARVTVYFSDGTVVQRIKGERNTVLLQKPDGTKKSFERIGNELPAEVLTALGNPPVNDKQGPLSYAEQLRPYFLITLTPTELPRIISELTQIDDYQEAADRLGKQARDQDKSIKSSQERVERYDSQLVPYQTLGADEEFLSQCEEQAEFIESLESQLSYLKFTMARMKEIIIQGKNESELLAQAKQIAIHADTAEHIKSIMEKLSKLNYLYENSQRTYDEISENEQYLSLYQKCCSEISIRQSAHAHELLNIIESVKDKYTKIRQITTSASEINSEIRLWKNTLSDVELEKKNLVLSMQSQGYWCDSCNRPLFQGDLPHEH